MSFASLSTLILLLALWPGQALSRDSKETKDSKESEESKRDPAVLEAEHQRLSEEMAQLANRQLWTGIEGKYRECENLGVTLTLSDYVNGALAARGLGDALSAHQRLRAANQIRTDKEVIEWLWNIDISYGHVVLEVAQQRSAELQPDAMPFAPDQRSAVEYAMEKVRKDGYFKGLLPAGGYNLAGDHFVVQPGIDLQVHIDAKQRKYYNKQTIRDDSAYVPPIPAPGSTEEVPSP